MSTVPIRPEDARPGGEPGSTMPLDVDSPTQEPAPAAPVAPTQRTEPAEPTEPAAPTEPPAPTQTWIEGPHWAAVIVGLVCVVAGGLALWQLASGELVDWGRYGPVGLGVVGLVMLLAGTIGLIRRGRAADGSGRRT